MISFLKDITIRKFWILKIIYNKKQSYFEESGWIKSFKNKKPLDRLGNPIPWISLPLFNFLKDRLNNKMDLFEYGAGNSTLYFTKYVNSVDSVEDNITWYNYLKENNLKNWTIYNENINDGDKYYNKANTTTKKYDIIIVDGRKRVLCTKSAINALKDTGILILDDSHRENYTEAIDFMLSNNFKKIDFWGLGSGTVHTKNSTIFYRKNNCLNI